MHHAQSSVMIIQSSLLQCFLPDSMAVKRSSKTNEELQNQNEEIKKEFKDKISILAVSYHNLGVEQEFLKMYQESLESYK